MHLCTLDWQVLIVSGENAIIKAHQTRAAQTQSNQVNGDSMDAKALKAKYQSYLCLPSQPTPPQLCQAPATGGRLSQLFHQC